MPPPHAPHQPRAPTSAPPTLPDPQVYPTDTRAFFHGISAASGKLGAIIAASVFSNVRRRAGAGAAAVRQPRR